MTTFNKLQPDQDLQCYFERPSAIAAISQATPNGFVLSGTWRQQFDWAVVDWTRDNVFEHPMHRNLPDGDLSGLVLTYDETRLNCIPLDSNLYPTVDWPYLRAWVEVDGVEQIHKINLKKYAAPIVGEYRCATATFTLTGVATSGDYIGLSWSDEQYNYQLGESDSLESAVTALASAINSLSVAVTAEQSGTEIKLIYVGAAAGQAESQTGANGNRMGAYGFVSGARTESWSPRHRTFQGGASPAAWRISLDFSNLTNSAGEFVPMTAVRKLRWTYSADVQANTFQQLDFQVVFSNWQVTGSGRNYFVAGRGSKRIEESDRSFSYAGSWREGYGNFSGGSIKFTTEVGAIATCNYTCPIPHRLYLGTRYSLNAAACSVVIDGGPITVHKLAIIDDDILCRRFLGELPPGDHTVEITHSGKAGEPLYVDFAEAARPCEDREEMPDSGALAVATDWDTDHSLALPAERTAWNVLALGLTGRVNHYAGALVFYAMECHEHSYASATISFVGTPTFSNVTTIGINRNGQPASSETLYSHQNLIGDTPETIAMAFELLINNGSTAIWAQASGSTLNIWSRTLGSDGNQLTVAVTPTSGAFSLTTEGFAGGVDGYWRTHTTATTRINRAARDWTRSFFTRLRHYGLDATAAFSMELQHGDASIEAGLAQRYPSGNAVLLNTPALQTNFSPVSLAYWKEVYREMAQIMVEAGQVPYLQFGEVQWWYFPYDGSGMPFYDAYTTAQFELQHGFPLRVIADGSVDPAFYAPEAAFLRGLVGSFTEEIMTYVRSHYPTCRFEVLYPTDVNEGPFNRVVNLPANWTSDSLDCIKTESFTYTFERNLDKARHTLEFEFPTNFPRNKRSHLIGVSDARSSWLREAELAKGSKVESVVLFALDQLCLIGYALPLQSGSSRSTREN